MGLWMGIRFPSFGTHSSYPQGQRSGGRGEEKLRFPQITEKRGGGLGGEIPLSPKLSAPYVLAYVSSLTEYLGEGSGGTSNWGRGW